MTQQYNIDTSNARATRSAIMAVSVYAESNDNIIIEADIDGVRQMRQHGNDNGDANDDDTTIQY